MKFSKSRNYLRGRWILLAVTLMLLLCSPAPAQQLAQDFEHKLSERTITFETVNPYTKVPGNVTITISGNFLGQRFSSGMKTGWSAIKGNQKGSFKFVPYDSSQPTYVGDFKFGLSGEIPLDRRSDVLPLSFIIRAVGTDGSQMTFAQSQFATVNEYGADVSFGDLTRFEPEASTNAEAKP